VTSRGALLAGAGAFLLCIGASGVFLYRTVKSVNEPDVKTIDRFRAADLISKGVGTKVRVDELLYVNRDDNAYVFHGDAEGLGKLSETVHFSRITAMDGKLIFIAVWNTSPDEVSQGVARVYSQLSRFGVSGE
jgi:hypothetical protein